MRKLVGAVATAALASVVLAVPVLAHDGPDGKGEARGWDWKGPVCRTFELVGTVTAAEARSVTVDVERAEPRRLVDAQVVLGVGSRTWLRGAPAVGALVHARGLACRTDDGDAPVFYTQKLRVKEPKAEAPAKVVLFELVGTVEGLGEDVVEVDVGRANVERLAGQVVRVQLTDDTRVEGDLAEGEAVLVVGWAKPADGGTALVAKLVVVKERSAVA